MTIKPFLLIFFDNFEKACFAILFFNLSSLWQDFLLLYIQHNENYVAKISEERCYMKEFEAFLAKASNKKATWFS